uniref:Protein TIFY n=1 Tax=Ananas comosus var. bracteatus TaxID=296719 RepID=A0A6V7P2L1_ANACO|nr:unnamed protein product [Ananas comosus var. bracteatus]
MEREKTNFSITCSLLSKFMKEKGSIIGGLGLEIRGPKPLQQQANNGIDSELATMNLLDGVNASVEEQIKNAGEQHESAENPHFNGSEKAQLTIFYGGEVLVFDDFSAGKVEELMRMAKETSSSVQNFRIAVPQFAASPTDHKLKSSSQNTAVPRPAQAIASDIPLVRRNSLHRFLAKRRERINTKAPYQLNYSLEAKNAAKTEDNNKSWLGLGSGVIGSEHELRL